MYYTATTTTTTATVATTAVARRSLDDTEGYHTTRWTPKIIIMLLFPRGQTCVASPGLYSCNRAWPRLLRLTLFFLFFYFPVELNKTVNVRNRGRRSYCYCVFFFLFFPYEFWRVFVDGSLRPTGRRPLNAAVGVRWGTGQDGTGAKNAVTLVRGSWWSVRASADRTKRRTALADRDV